MQIGRHCPTFGSSWQILGPFQIGTREAPWGADPLERYGGFHSLSFDLHSHWPSSLAVDGTVQWTEQATTPSRPGTLNTYFRFEQIDWRHLQQTYGWPALQYQAWARTTFDVPGVTNGTYNIHVQGVLEYWIDDEHYFGGDFYSFGNAPLVTRLAPGVHSLEIRLVRDVRAVSAEPPPEIAVDIAFAAVESPLTAVTDSLLLPDLVDGRFASSLASALITNNDQHAASGFTIASQDESVHCFDASAICIVPGQTRQLSFRMSADGREPAATAALRISYNLEADTANQEQIDSSGIYHCIDLMVQLTRRSSRDAQKITFRHPGGAVSYAILRPPLMDSSPRDGHAKNLPVLLALHGAGVDADSDMARHSLDGVADIAAWTLMPSGGTPWCGDDWHQWGWADAEAAIRAIPVWMRNSAWKGPGVDIERWLVIGHSNGGQGVWYALANRPDNIIAAAPLSGYSSIQSYVPYTLWLEADPLKHAVVQAALGKYRHEAIVPSNAQGIPIAIQHGSADNNVPPFHSRRMKQLLAEAGHSAEYFEITEAGHWFDGIMTTEYLRNFYHEQLAQKDIRSQPSESFTVRAIDPSSTSSKHGIRIIRLKEGGRSGIADVHIVEKCITVTTANVHSLTLDMSHYSGFSLCFDDFEPTTITCDGRDNVAEVSYTGKGTAPDIVRGESNTMMSPSGLDAILRTKGIFTILNRHKSSYFFSLQVARNLMQYYGADSNIVEHAADSAGNQITVGIGASVPSPQQPGSVVKTDSNQIRICPSGCEPKAYDGGGIGAIFLRPFHPGRLDMVIWGTDETGLGLAARLMPTVTGVGQPDFIVVGEAMKWKGLGGALALGFFNHDWKVSAVSYFE